MGNVVHILDGAIALYQRLYMGAQTWTARYKIKGHKGYVTSTTGKRDLEEAKEVALEKYHELSADHRRGIAIHSRTFQRSVDAYLDDLAAAVASGKKTARTQRDNKAVIDRYLLPYFKSKATDRHGEKFAPYSLRHTYATDRLINGRVDVWLLAKNMGTSVEMIRKHYGQDEPQQRSEELTHDKQQLDMKTWVAMLTENPAMAEALLRKAPEGPTFDPDAPEAEPDPNVPRRRAKIRLSDMLD